jgi:hypothetical protein
MKKLMAIAVTIFLAISTAFGQTIEIGQKASSIKAIVEYQVSSYYNAQGYHQVKMFTDTKYADGEISDVILCYVNQYLIDFRITADFCKHYIMEYGKLAYVLTQYENVSTEKLKSLCDQSYGDYKLGDYYFSDDYEHYSQIYLAKNGYATVEWRKTEPDLLPTNLKTKIANKLKAEQESESKKLREEEERKQKEKEIKSKTYDLETYDTAKYKLFVNNLQQSLLESLKSNSSFPDWYKIEKENQKNFTFKNTYSAHYKLVDYSRESVDYGSYIEAGSNDVRSENKFTLITGDDNSCNFLINASPSLPTINYQGYTVMTEAKVYNIIVNYTKGITNIKIKNGVVMFKKYLPSAGVQSILTDKLKNEPNGLYQLKYEVGQAMGDNFVTIEKQKMKSVAGKILIITGSILVAASVLLIL